MMMMMKMMIMMMMITTIIFLFDKNSMKLPLTETGQIFRLQLIFKNNPSNGATSLPGKQHRSKKCLLYVGFTIKSVVNDN